MEEQDKIFPIGTLLRHKTRNNVLYGIVVSKESVMLLYIKEHPNVPHIMQSKIGAIYDYEHIAQISEYWIKI